MISLPQNTTPNVSVRSTCTDAISGLVETVAGVAVLLLSIASLSVGEYEDRLNYDSPKRAARWCVGCIRKYTGTGSSCKYGG